VVEVKTEPEINLEVRPAYKLSWKVNQWWRSRQNQQIREKF